MSTIVFLEKEGSNIRKTSLEAISYACEISKKANTSVTGVAFGDLESSQLTKTGIYGCDKLIHVNEPSFNQAVINVFAHALNQIMIDEAADLFITAQSALADPIAAKIAILQKASIATNVSELPNIGNEFIVRRSIYSGKAFEDLVLTSPKKVISIKRNAVGLIENQKDVNIENSELKANSDMADAVITGSDKSSGKVLLPEADIVVSAGRGLKGPENWEMIEKLANELGAAIGCSKPVSDVGWRPHHEHVGQTGIKVAPNLYIAIGISGAIQHIAGVSSSKVIVVINNDPEAPFFKNADYGIVGDAFEVVPKLIDVIRENK
jgi:electron transfer flavoprotein alpha subunit